MAVKHIEPAGITYDRFRFDRLAGRLIERYGIRTVCEVPAGGEKAMPSIYSLAFGVKGCKVHLVRSVAASRRAWEALGLADRVTFDGGDPEKTGLPDSSFDLVWNFVTLTKEKNFEGVLREMARVSRNIVLTVHYNGLGLGFPWHRLIHKAFGFPWTHGETRYNFPGPVREAYRKSGLQVVETFPFDCPPWPDPPGIRDYAIHKRFGEIPESDAAEWKAPVVDYYLKGGFPWWMRALNFMEDLPIPRILKYPFSHLFYVLGKKRA
jgi:hypothetical protein